MFVTGTVNFACNTRVTQLMFIDNRGFPGGPMAWFFANYPMNTAGNAGYVVANFFADALLVSTCCGSKEMILNMGTALAYLPGVEHCLDHNFPNTNFPRIDGCGHTVVTLPLSH